MGRWLSFALAVAAVLLTGACGGDDRLSRAEYLREADAICEEYEGKLDEHEQKLADADDPEQLASVIGAAIPVVEEGVDALRELEPPKDLERPVNRWLELNEKNADTLERLRDAAAAGDSERLEELVQAGEANEQRADELARDIGLDACAEEE